MQQTVIASTKMSPQAHLEATRSLVRAVSKHHIRLASEYPEPFASDLIADQHLALLDACEQSLESLKSPVLRVSLMGTTSSGKSTLANGLVGRRVAPIEALEMSAGVLRFASSPTPGARCSGAVDASLNADWGPIDDLELYDRITEVLKHFHKARRTATVTAPSIDIEGGLLPSADASLLALPTGVELELLDLPGLRSLNDIDNLRFIQNTIGRSLSLVTLDYRQIDEDHREALLRELKEVVQTLGGRTDLMVFVLNRVDERGSDDMPLEDRVQLLSVEIQETLGLAQPAAVLPLSARLLYWAQVAWGPAPLSGEPATDEATRRGYLGNLLKDCRNELGRIGDEDRDFRGLIRRLEDACADGQSISTEDLRQLVAVARNRSGGDELWRTFRQRVAEAFREVVILPAVADLLRVHGQLIGSLGAWASAEKNQSLLEVTEACRRLEAERDAVMDALGRSKTQLDADIHKAMALLGTDEYQDLIEARKTLGDLADLTDATNEVKARIEGGLIDDLHHDLKARITRVTFAERYKSLPGMPPEQIVPLFDAYDAFWSALGKASEVQLLEVQDDAWVVRAASENGAHIALLDEVERSYHALLEMSADPLSVVSHYWLQAQAMRMKSAAARLLDGQQVGAHEAISGLALLPGIRDQLLEELELGLQADAIPELQVPDLTSQVDRNQTQQLEQTGTRDVWEKKRFLLVFSRTKWRSVPIMEQIAYTEISLPGPNQIRSGWMQAVETMGDDVLSSLLEWVGELLREAREAFTAHVNGVTEVALRFLGDRRTVIEQQGEGRRTQLNELDGAVDDASALQKQLRSYSRSKGVEDAA